MLIYIWDILAMKSAASFKIVSHYVIHDFWLTIEQYAWTNRNYMQISGKQYIIPS
jgi:hypothetical protein